MAREHPIRGRTPKDTRGFVLSKVVITGAQGFLGRHVVAEALATETDIQVLGLGRSPRSDDRFTFDLAWPGGRQIAPVPRSLLATASDRRYAYESVDLTDLRNVFDVLRAFAPELVIHAAGALRDEPWATLVSANLVATGVLMEATAMLSSVRPRVVLVSSGSIYGELPDSVMPIREDGPFAFGSPYGATKLIGEELATAIAATTDTPLVRARVFNLVGPGLQDRHLAGALAGQMAAIARGLAPPVVRVGLLDSTRDLVDVRDTAIALLTLARKGTIGSVYNVASGVETPMTFILEELQESLGITVTVDRQTGRDGDISRAIADVTRIRALGWRGRINLHQSLGDMVRYYFDDFPG